MADSDASGASGSALVRTRSRSLSPEDADQLAPLPVSQATRHSGRQRPRTASISQMHRSVELERPQTAGAGPLVDEDGAQGNVVVVCRVRPFNRRELSNIAAAPEPEEARDAAESTVSISEDLREVTLHTRGDQDHSFGFRRIFATRTTQEEVCLWASDSFQPGSRVPTLESVFRSTAGCAAVGISHHVRIRRFVRAEGRETAFRPPRSGAVPFPNP